MQLAAPIFIDSNWPYQVKSVFNPCATHLAADTLSATLTPNPNLSIVKSVTSNGSYALGDPINFSIFVTNTGNITLTNVSVSDNSDTLGTCAPTQPASLLPSGSMTCTASHIVT